MAGTVERVRGDMQVLGIFFIINMYAHQFSQDFNVKVTTKFYLEATQMNKHARCIHSSKSVYVNINHFLTLPKRHQKELIYHELGHCELHLNHIFGKAAIMRPGVYSTEVNSKNWNRLLKDMKNQRK